MKPSAMVLGILLFGFVACDGPAVPNLMFPSRADAGVTADASPPEVGEEGDDDPMNPGGIPLDCAELTRCMATCSGSRCGPKCLQRADARTQEIYSQVSVCAANNECRDPECIQDNCAEAWLDCQENIHPDERPDCPELRNCLRGCLNDADCREECARPAHQSTITQVATLDQCSRSAPCADEACRRDRCAEPLAACYPEHEILGFTCAELIECLEGCDGPGACQDECRALARPIARLNLEALDACQVACGPDLAACRTVCPVEFARCDP